MITFEPDEEQQLMASTVRDLAAQKLLPRVREIEAARALPADLAAALAELGLATLGVPESAGGASASVRTQVLVEEELAAGDAAVPFAMAGPKALGLALLELGSAAQRDRILRTFVDDPTRVGAVAWSEPRPSAEPGFSTTARPDGDAWILDGEKAYVIDAGRASTYVVFAQIDRSAGWSGFGAFLVDAAAAGLTVGARAVTLGLDAAHFGSLKLAGVRAERLETADVVRATLRFFARVSLTVAARAVGLARAAFDTTHAFTAERKAFGKPIGHFQAVAFNLVDRLVDVDSARGLVWRAAWTLDTHGDDDAAVLSHCSEAAAEALEAVQRCGADAVQLHGGAGFVRDYVVEKYMRDSKQLALCAPTVATSDALFAAISLGRPLDGALLPTPDIQPIFT